MPMDFPSRSLGPVTIRWRVENDRFVSDIPFQFAPFAAQWLMALLMIIVAAAYRLWRLGKSHRWEVLVLAAACLLYLAVAVILYARFALLADGLYHLSALVVTWCVLALLERRWFREKHAAA